MTPPAPPCAVIPTPCGEEARTGGEGGTPRRSLASTLPLETPGSKNLPGSSTSPEESDNRQSDERNTLGTPSPLCENRYRGLPVVFLMRPDGRAYPCPFLMSLDDVTAFFRLAESRTRFPRKTIERYRALGLRTVRVGRRVWFRLDDVLRFLDEQQERLACP